MKPILKVSNIGKRYKIGGKKQSYLSLSDSIVGFFTSKRSKETNEFWALKDVSFDVYPGESIGIIGKNGAGKSTLLKVLSKITPPTSGTIHARGRVASLLEVGTGFHPELTGRENVYLNGSILGLSRVEISNKFDEIIDFSGVEKFLETPLKHYSSGMQLRLAFAVAAHLEPEVLVIDEVLAVGDAAFQKKCLGKMDEVSKSGRTILFVSHNMAAVKQLCPNSILLSEGKVIEVGKTDLVVDKYFTSIKEGGVFKSKENHLQEFSIKKIENQNKGKLILLEAVVNNTTNDYLAVHFILKHKGEKLAVLSTEFIGKTKIPQGNNVVTCEFGPINLLAGEYYFDVYVDVPGVENLERHYDILSFNTEFAMAGEQVTHLKSIKWGCIAPEQKWIIK